MSTEDRELELCEQYRYATDELAEMSALRDAIDLASDQDQVTWLTENGKRIAAIVPVDVAEHGDMITSLQKNPAVQAVLRRL